MARGRIRTRLLQAEAWARGKTVEQLREEKLEKRRQRIHQRARRKWTTKS